MLNGFKENGCGVKIVSNERFLGINKFKHTVIEPTVFKKKFSWLGELLYNFYVKRRFKKEIVSVLPDFIYHRYTGYTFFVASIARKLKIPLILEFNSFDTWKIKYWDKGKIFFKELIKKYLLYNFIQYHVIKQIETYNLRNASLIMVVSQPLKKDLLKLNILERKILVNPNGVDPDKFNPEIARCQRCKRLRGELGISSDKIIVGFTGTFGVWHGIPQLTEAIDRIMRKLLLSNVHFILIGDGPLKENMEKQIAHHKDVTFTGEVPYSDIQYYLAICDILVSPHCPQIDGKEFFGSPTKLFEYMALGKAIVASRLGQTGKVLEHRRTDWLVKPGDVNELVEGILKLTKDKELRNFLGRNAREEVVANYTWKKNVERVINKLKML